MDATRAYVLLVLLSLAGVIVFLLMESLNDGPGASRKSHRVRTSKWNITIDHTDGTDTEGERS